MNKTKELITLMLKNAKSRVDAQNALIESMQDELSKIELNIPFVIVGGHAVNKYARVRSTSDVDLLVKIQDFEELCENHPEARPLSLNTESLIGITIGDIDILSSVSDWADFAVSDPNIMDNMPFVKKEYLILMKSISNTAKDVSDIIDIIKHSSEEEIEIAKQAISRFNNSSLEDFGSLITIAELETES